MRMGLKKNGPLQQPSGLMYHMIGFVKIVNYSGKIIYRVWDIFLFPQWPSPISLLNRNKITKFEVPKRKHRGEPK
jgi:hypothetical protein